MNTRESERCEKRIRGLQGALISGADKAREFIKDSKNKVELADVLVLVWESQTQLIEQQAEHMTQVKSYLDQITTLQNKITELSDQVRVLKEERAEQVSVAPLATTADPDTEDRILRLEAYSGRNTITIARLADSKEETHQTLKEKIVDIIGDGTGITLDHIGHAHRNGKWKDGAAKPRSVTVAITHSYLKDKVMRNWKRITGKHQVDLYHRMSKSLAERKKHLESRPEIDWVHFAGHRMFSVKFKDKSEILHNVTRI